MSVPSRYVGDERAGVILGQAMLDAQYSARRRVYAPVLRLLTWHCGNQVKIEQAEGPQNDGGLALSCPGTCWQRTLRDL